VNSVQVNYFIQYSEPVNLTSPNNQGWRDHQNGDQRQYPKWL